MLRLVRETPSAPTDEAPCDDTLARLRPRKTTPTGNSIPDTCSRWLLEILTHRPGFARSTARFGSPWREKATGVMATRDRPSHAPPGRRRTPSKDSPTCPWTPYPRCIWYPASAVLSRIRVVATCLHARTSEHFETLADSVPSSTADADSQRRWQSQNKPRSQSQSATHNRTVDHALRRAQWFLGTYHVSAKLLPIAPRRSVHETPHFRRFTPLLEPSNLFSAPIPCYPGVCAARAD